MFFVFIYILLSPIVKSNLEKVASHRSVDASAQASSTKNRCPFMPVHTFTHN